MSREKYEAMKVKAQGWMEKAIQYEGEIERLTYENQQLGEALSEALSTDPPEVPERDMKKEIEYERILMRKDVEIDRLKASLEDYKERYKEIRDDNKEFRKMSRNIT